MPVAPKSYAHERNSKLAKARERARPSREARGYGPTWKKIRDAYIRKHPLCVGILPNGEPCGRAASQVDHIIPHRGTGDPMFWDHSNFQSFCSSCHSRKSATFDGALGNPVTRPTNST